jgi:hypothetical protein
MSDDSKENAESVEGEDADQERRRKRPMPGLIGLGVDALGVKPRPVGS